MTFIQVTAFQATKVMTAEFQMSAKWAPQQLAWAQLTKMKHLALNF